MGKTVISVEHLSKRYDLGVIGTGTISRDLNRWWARLRGNPDPYARIGEVDHGNRRGESILALDDVSFKVEQGEVLGIIGGNGAGKSTLLKILSQVTAPTSGEVKIKGRIGSLLEVGTGFHPELTGRENVYLNGAILGMTRGEVDRKFDEIVDFSGVEKFIDTPVKRYSSGMKVRLGFAVAAHLDPEILIVDEVLAVGDAEFQKKCLGKMGDVAHEGRTVLFVSHNMGAVDGLCQNAICLKAGEIVKSSNVKETIDYYYANSNINDKDLIRVIDGVVDLSKRNNKHGNRLLVEKLILKNSNNKETNLFRANEKMTLELRICNLQFYPNTRFGVIFKTLLGQKVFSFDTDMKSNANGFLYTGKDRAVLFINKLPLNTGSYSIDISFFERNVGRIDFIQDAVQIDVVASDIYSNGYIIKNNYGITFLKDAYWEISSG